ncbi:MAG: OsmC family protein [Chloroflexi bacterium]|nr:OsmC family protein [Chloroflexota bacterium]
MTKTASAEWRGGLSFEGSAGSGFRLRMGGGGEEPGFSPMELVLVGLAGCTAMDVISILQKKRQAVTAFDVRVTGTRADQHPKVYTEIEIEYLVEGHWVDPAAVARAIELSQDKYCSVSAMLRKGSTVRTSYRVTEAPAVAPVEAA